MSSIECIFNQMPSKIHSALTACNTAQHNSATYFYSKNEDDGMCATGAAVKNMSLRTKDLIKNVFHIFSVIPDEVYTVHIAASKYTRDIKRKIVCTHCTFIRAQNEQAKDCFYRYITRHRSL